jgi:hypothetical protein
MTCLATIFDKAVPRKERAAYQEAASKARESHFGHTCNISFYLTDAHEFSPDQKETPHKLPVNHAYTLWSILRVHVFVICNGVPMRESAGQQQAATAEKDALSLPGEVVSKYLVFTPTDKCST